MKKRGKRERSLRSVLTAVLLVLAAALAVPGTALLLHNYRTEKAAEAAVVRLLDEREDTGEAIMEGYYGILTVPELDLTLPVLEEYKKADLKLMPCRYSGGLESENLVLVGHNYSQHFGRFLELAEGAAVQFEAKDGSTHSYRVAKLETLEPTDIEEMVESEWALTLFTCTYDEKELLTLRCEEQV